MAWDTQYALDGIFMFGGPLNVYRYEIDNGKFGQSTETYHVIHFRIDNDPHLWTRIMEKMNSSKSIEYFPQLYLMERISPNSYGYKMVNTFYKPWLFSLLKDYGGTRSPFYSWEGHTLAIACNKKDNPHITSTDW